LDSVLLAPLPKAGADLVLTSRERARLSPFAEEMQGLGRRTLSLELDVRNHDSIDRMAAAAEKEFGHLDILVNNAGLQHSEAGARRFLGRLERDSLIRICAGVFSSRKPWRGA